MVSSSDMSLYVELLRAGSFTRAARKLGITKQTLSQHIANLEKALGVRLLERTTRQMRATEIGAAFGERCSAIAALIEQATAEAQRGQVQPIGLLRLSAPVLYGRRFLMPTVSAFARRYPQTRVDVVLSDRHVNLIEEGFDLAIRVGALDDSSLVAHKLGQGMVFCVAAPGFLAEQTVLRPQDLGNVRCVGTRTVESWLIGAESVKVEPAVMVNDLEAACEAAVEGAGVARLPLIICRNEIANGRLTILFGPEPAARRNIYVLYPSRDNLPSKVRLFIEMLEPLVEPHFSAH